MLQAESRGNGVALGIKVGGEHTRAGAAGQRGMHQADRALADHQHRIVGGEIEQLHALEHGVHRLDEGRLLKGHAVGNAHHAAVGDDEVHHANVLGKAAAGGLEAGRDAGLLVERALRGRLLAAVVALAAGDVMEAHHALADCEAGDALADWRRWFRPFRGRRCAARSASRCESSSDRCRRCRRWRS